MGLDQVLHHLIAKVNGFDHVGFGQLVGPGFHHDHTVGRTRHNQIQVAIFHFLIGGVDDKIVAHEAHAHRCHRPIEGNFRQQHRHGSARCRQHIGGHLLIHGEGGGHNLNVVPQPLGEQGPHGAVDQTADQRGPLRRTTLPTQKATGDASGGVEAFFVIYQ